MGVNVEAVRDRVRVGNEMITKYLAPDAPRDLAAAVAKLAETKGMSDEETKQTLGVFFDKKGKPRLQAPGETGIPGIWENAEVLQAFVAGFEKAGTARQQWEVVSDVCKYLGIEAPPKPATEDEAAALVEDIDEVVKGAGPTEAELPELPDSAVELIPETPVAEPTPVTSFEPPITQPEPTYVSAYELPKTPVKPPSETTDVMPPVLASEWEKKATGYIQKLGKIVNTKAGRALRTLALIAAMAHQPHTHAEGATGMPLPEPTELKAPIPETPTPAEGAANQAAETPEQAPEATYTLKAGDTLNDVSKMLLREAGLDENNLDWQLRVSTALAENVSGEQKIGFDYTVGGITYHAGGELPATELPTGMEINLGPGRNYIEAELLK